MLLVILKFLKQEICLILCNNKFCPPKPIFFIKKVGSAQRNTVSMPLFVFFLTYKKKLTCFFSKFFVNICCIFVL